MKGSATKPLSHGDRAQHASHPAWAFRREAAIWRGEVPVGVNMLPLATEMCQWLKQQRHGLHVLVESERGDPGQVENPYAYHASAIGASLGAIINAICTFVDADDEMDAIEAEIVRVRLQAELILYCARFCEATIKQMLYCTQVPRRLYKSASLGQLLAVDCEACRKQGKDRHDISLLGGLAHQYFLCHEIDHCVVDHLLLFGNRRNRESAHAESVLLDPQGVAESRRRLSTVMRETGDQLGHMTDHVGRIESRMIQEIDLIAQYYPEQPSPQAFMMIPARPRVKGPVTGADDAPVQE